MKEAFLTHETYKILVLVAEAPETPLFNYKSHKRIIR